VVSVNKVHNKPSKSSKSN